VEIKSYNLVAPIWKHRETNKDRETQRETNRDKENTQKQRHEQKPKPEKNTKPKRCVKMLTLLQVVRVSLSLAFGFSIINEEQRER